MNELEQLTQLCIRLGAEGAQAGIMAAQLSKRADQLAAQRGIPRAEAMASLLRLVVNGRNGEAPPDPAEKPLATEKS